MNVLCTEKRIREAVRAAADRAKPAGPYWVRDGRDGPERALYLRRHGSKIELRQTCACGDPARRVDPILADAPANDLPVAYAHIAQAIEARGFTIN